MTNVLLTLILIILILTYLNWTTGNIRDYLGWRRKQLKGWLNKKKAQR